MAKKIRQTQEETAHSMDLLLFKVTEEGEDFQHFSKRVTLEEWLELLKNRPAGISFHSYSFPCHEFREEYLATVSKRSLSEVKWLLKRFLPPDEPLGSDKRSVAYGYTVKHFIELKQTRELPYHAQRWLIWALSKGKMLSPREPVYWILDLVDWAPEEAIRVLEAYIMVYCQLLPDGRLYGLYDCMQLIRVRWLGASVPDEVIDSISWRDLEHLVERLYKAMGYSTVLTPCTRDGGRDVIASKEEKGAKIQILVQVTRPHSPVRVGAVRQVQGVVATERASKGVILTTSRFTKDALELEKKDARLELIARKDFIRLMNSYLGIDWPSEIDRLITESKLAHLRKQENGPIDSNN